MQSRNNPIHTVRGLIGRAACVIALLLLVGCVTTSIKPNPDVMKSFTEMPKTGHAYFLSGTEKSPNGIIAIDTHYTLDSDSWKSLDPSTVAGIVETMNEKAVEVFSNITFGDILTKDGTDIGDFVIYFGGSLRVKVKGNIVTAYPPSGLGSGGDGGGGGSGGGSGGGGGGSGGGCFTPRTPVVMADGTMKPIEEITIGDSVKSYDFQRNKVTSNKVTALLKFQRTEHLIINGIAVTRTHPFCTGKGEWKEAGMLQAGDVVIGENNTEIAIETIEKVKRDVTVYNLTVDGTHNYFVSNGKTNFLVHNKVGGK